MSESNKTNKQPQRKPATKPPINKTVPKRKPIPKVAEEQLEKKKPTVKKSNVKKTPKKKPVSKQVVKEEIVKGVETDFGKKTEKKGKVFYLVFSLVFFTAAFFYINNIVYDNNDYLQSALFAFAALFVVFVLLQFNIHMIFINFFRLPIKYLIDNSRVEINTRKESKFSFGKFKSTLALIIYILFLLLLIGSNTYNDIVNEVKILSSLSQSLAISFVYLIIVCSWQYLFNIIPNILEKSIDAKNGFILTLSAAVMIIFVLFQIFEISYLSELMIFILIIGFIALLGVNLNMIVGEINIFQNLRKRHSKTVTRVVFLIFFSFHLYVLLYASVVAFSIYSWEPQAYNFSNTEYKEVVVDEVYNGNELVTDVYDQYQVAMDTVYDFSGNEITEFFDEDGKPLFIFAASSGQPTGGMYNQTQNNLEPHDQDFQFIWAPTNEDGEVLYDVYYANGNVYGFIMEEQPHNYGDFLYYTVVTTSTLGYGDITPNLNYNMAQFWGGFLSVYGFTFFALSISFVSNIAIEGATRKEEDKND
jgi:hypothetical protein